MANRDTTNNGEKDQEERDIVNHDDSVPGAHGKPGKSHQGASGATLVRGPHDEIQPSEDVDDA